MEILHTSKRGVLLTAGMIAMVLQGCSPEPAESVQENMPGTDLSLAGTSWRVEDIDQRGIIDLSNVTLEFVEDGRVAGSGGCNSYFGAVAIAGTSISFTGLGATSRACAEALMNQEQHFFAALNEITSFRTEADSRRLILDSSGTRRLILIEFEPDSTAQDTTGPLPQDAALQSGTEFDCGEAGIAVARFLGPETLEFTLGDRSGVLQRVRTASGARYVGDDLDFWNKGDEALLSVDGVQYDCVAQR